MTRFYRRFAWNSIPKPCPICGKNAYSVWSNRPFPHLMGENAWKVQTCDVYCAEIAHGRGKGG